MNTHMPEGPLLPTYRTTVPGTMTYVEFRQERWTSRGIIGYEIETGDIRWGHRGTWGRDFMTDARKCFTEAITYAALNH